MYFNKAVQGDYLMFFEDSHGHVTIILHLIDECIRWTVVVEAASKEGYIGCSSLVLWKV